VQHLVLLFISEWMVLAGTSGLKKHLIISIGTILQNHTKRLTMTLGWSGLPLVTFRRV